MSHPVSPGEWQFVANQLKENAMKRSIEDGLSLLAGLGVGTALMYLMDPASGSQRRQMIGEAARSSLDSARETFADATESLSQRARDAASGLSSGVSEHADYARSMASDYSKRLSRRARHMMPQSMRLQQEQHTSAGEVAGYAAGGLALFALGAGLAYLFDPDRGRARRAYLGQQFVGRSNDVTDFARRTGKHWANKARGYASEARSAVSGMTGSQSESSGGTSGASMPSSQPSGSTTSNTM
jgi:gas vesicle protein